VYPNEQVHIYSYMKVYVYNNIHVHIFMGGIGSAALHGLMCVLYMFKDTYICIYIYICIYVYVYILININSYMCVSKQIGAHIFIYESI
jgi:hypothetical protein